MTPSFGSTSLTSTTPASKGLTSSMSPGLSPAATAALAGKTDAAGSRAAKAKANGEDFEAMFLNSMFSQMTSGLKGEGPFGDTPGTGVWRSMLTEQYSKNFANAGGVGIATDVYRTLIMQQAKTIRTA